MYSATPRLCSTTSDQLGSVLDLGLPQRFVEDSASLLPRVVLTQEVPVDEFSGGLGGSLARLRLIVLVTPRGDPLLIFEAYFDHAATAVDVVNYMIHMHAERDSMTMGGAPFVEWLRPRLDMEHPLRIGYAHQMVFAGGGLADLILSEGPSLGLRPGVSASLLHCLAPEGPDLGWQVDIRMPEAINSQPHAVVAHGRMATIVSGWNQDVQNSLLLVALTLVAAIAVLQQSRIRAFRALEHSLNCRTDSIDQMRDVHARLAAELSEVQLDLSFGAETYIDGVLVPDSRMDSFRRSLNDVVGIDASLANTSRIMERLGAVIHARSSVINAAVQESQERRDRVMSVVLTVGTLLALPPALLLAFFGVSSSDVDHERSLLDLSHYWLAYVLAWIPFVALLLVGSLLRRRIRAARPRIAYPPEDRRTEH